MRKLTAYNFLALNGYFKGPNEDTNWHTHGEEEARYSEEALEQDENILLFGRKTYEMMVSFWPTPQAKEMFPDVAAGMNRAEKIVFSKSPFEPEWENTRVISGDIVEEMRAIKKSPGKNMTILGSGTIINLFTDHGLIDDYQFMIDPVALPDGTPVFKNIKRKLDLQLTGSKVFKSGIVLLNYQLKSNLPTGLAKPAQRALASAGYSQLEQLTNVTEKEISELHGMGPNAIQLLREALAEQGWAFATAPEE